MRIDVSRSLLAVWAAGLAACDSPMEAPQPLVGGVAFAVDSTVIPAVGFERTLEATAFSEGGQPLPAVPLVWGSRSPHIVQVTSSGVARGRALGTALVIVSAGAFADTMVVHVVQVPATFELTGPDTMWSAAGRETVSLIKIDSAGVPIPDEPEWVSSSPTVAQGYNDGGNFPRVASYGVGEARIRATLRGVSSNEIRIVVRQRPASLFLGYTRNSLTVGDTMGIRAYVKDATDVDIPNAPVTWLTSDSTVARISPSGLVTAVGGGYVLLTGRSGSIQTSGTMPVYPTSPPPGTLHVSPSAHSSDGYGEQIPIRAVVDDGVSPPKSVPATWVSRNTAVATVTPYFATTRGDGATWLVATYDGRTDSLQVQVQRVPVAITFQGLPRAFAITYSSGAPIYPGTVDRFGGLSQVALTTTWTVRDPAIVQATGSSIDALRKGSTWVVVEMEGLRDSVNVTVIPRLEEDFSIVTSAHLQYFREREVEEVRGNLRIHATGLSSLDGLEALLTVTGELRITSNAALADIDGLANLESAGAVLIEDNPALTVAFPRLREAGSIRVFRNLTLESHSFGALRQVSAELDLGVGGPTIYFDSLVSTGSMMWQGPSPAAVHYPRLAEIGNDFWLAGTSQLVTVSAPLLWRARTITLLRNARLTTLQVPSLSTLTGDLTIQENTVLANLDAFATVSSGLRRLLIDGNPSLTSMDGLRQLGDALGSDPILLEACTIRRNPLLAGWQAVLSWLNAKFSGGVPAACAVS